MFRRYFEPGALLSYKGFRNLWLAGLLMVIGGGIFPIAIAVVVIDSGGDATTLGMILAARLLSGVGMTLVGGVWADRLSRKKVLFASDISRGLLTLTLVFVSAGDIPRYWMALIVFLMGIGDAFATPASIAIVPSLLPSERLQEGNVTRGVTSRLGNIIGPGIGGVSVGLIGARDTFIVVAVLMFTAAFLIIRVHEPPIVKSEDRETFIYELKDGLRTVWEMPWAAGMILMATLQLMVVLAAENVLLPVITKREFETNSVMAMAMGAFSVGAAISAIVSMKLKVKHEGQFAVIIWSFLALLPLVLAFPSSPWVIIIGYLIGGISVGPWDAFWPSAIQREIPPEKQGRVFAVDHAGSAGMMPLGMALVGPVTSLVGEQRFLLFAVVFHIIVNILVLQIPGVKDMRTPRNSSIGEQEKRG